MTEYLEYLNAEDLESLQRTLAGTWTEVWPRVQGIWKRADEVHVGITGPAVAARLHLDYALALELSRRFPEAVPALRAALFEDTPALVAYSVLALMESPSWNRDQLNDSIFLRAEVLRWHSGCHRWEQSLGAQVAEFVAPSPVAVDPWEAAKEAERRWAGRMRTCPKCRSPFTSVQNLGVCPQCQQAFRASDGSSADVSV